MNTSTCDQQNSVSCDDLDIGDMFEILNYLFQNNDPHTVLNALDNVLDKILASLDAHLHSTSSRIWHNYFQSLDKNLTVIDKIAKTKYILAKIVQDYKDFWQQDDLQPAITQACDNFEQSPQCAVDGNTVYVENPGLAKNLHEYFQKYQTSHQVQKGVPASVKTRSTNEAQAVMKLIETIKPSTALTKISNDIFYRYARMKTLQNMSYRQKNAKS